MADLKISDLSALSGSDLVAADELAIVDDSASETKKITVSNLIANGVTLISDDAIPGAKILFGAGDIATAALADSAVTAAKIGADQVTAAKIADNTIVNLVSTLPTSGDYTGQLALDTDDNSLYVYSGSAWLNTKAPGSVNAFTDTTSGIINITTAVSSGTATITALLDNTTSAAQFLAGPVGSAGAVGYRTINGGDLPTAQATAKGGVMVNGGGLTLSTDTIQIDNSVTASSVKHLVTYNANGLITGGSAIASSDLPVATSSAKGAVIASDGLAVDSSGNLSIDNTVTAGTYTKVTVTAKGVVSSGSTLVAADIPDHSAAKLTSGTVGSSLIANDAITAAKMADQSTTKFGGALGSDNVTIFPSGDFKGQFFYDETTQDLYIYTGSAFVPVTVLSGNLVNAGAYNASTNQMSSVTSAGSAAGFSVGAALPAPAVTNLNHYVVVATSGTGSGAAPAVALAPPDMLLSQGVGTEYSLIDVSNAIAGQTASNISLIAAGDIVATDVQAGIQELDTEKLPKAGGTMTGNLNLGTSTNVVFEGSSADDYETTLTVTNPTADRTITLPNVTGTVVTTGDTGSVTSTMILDGTVNNGDINANAEIAVSKLANGTARQLLQTDSGGSGVEFTSNVDVPGTLDVTSGATFDSTVAVTGLLSANGKLAYPAGSAAAVSLYSGSDTDTGIYSPGSNQFGISTAGTSRVVVDSSGLVKVTGGIHVTENVTPTAGSGIEIFKPTSTTGQIQAYNRSSSAWMDLIIKGNTQQFHVNGSQRMLLDSSGNLDVGGPASNSFTSGARISSGGKIASYVSSSTTGTDQRIYVYNGSTASYAATINANGSAVFGQAPNNSNATGVGILDPGGAIAVQADGKLFRGHAYSNGAETSAISDAGSATFASGSILLDSSAFISSERTFSGDSVSQVLEINTSTNKSYLRGYVTGVGSSAFEIQRDGSATFNGISTPGATTVLDTGNHGVRIGLGATGTNIPGLIAASRDVDGTGVVAYFTGNAGGIDLKGDGSAEFDGNVLVGTTTNGSTAKGIALRSTGELLVSRNSGPPMLVNRLTDDGSLIDFRGQNNSEGSISVSGSTVSYNGAHLSRWSQLSNGADRIEILRGSVLSNLDEMCEWAYEAQDAVLYTEEDELPEGVSVGDVKTPARTAGKEDNEQLNRMKVSDVEGDKNVSGVFQSWDDDDDTYTNDFYCAMTGDFVIRIAKGTTVTRGDLLMSAGDGTAKPQDDDIVRSKTVAKVTSTTVSETYADGSYCVPCVLMAC
jgi:hypothetical protein